MTPIQFGTPGMDGLGLAARAAGHLLACLVAVAVGEGASRRRIEPRRVFAGGAVVAIATPLLVVVGIRTDALAPLVAVAGSEAVPYAVGASALVLGLVAVADAASGRGRPRRWTPERLGADGAADRPSRAGGAARDLAVGVLAATTALLAGEHVAVALTAAL
ncbi:hypothetical protein [Halobaculum sp. EA56]|uniref:hypothetical protein n=1 Tax=Halobaculum sp. EA56 TaxID=3421648 RepID=UPI003EB6A0E0